MFARAGQVLVVENPLAGIRLLDLLQRELGGAPRSHRERVARGGIRVNGMECLHDGCLRVGDVVEVLGDVATAAPPSARAAREGRQLPAVHFESATALVVAKPAGLPTVPDRSGADRGLHGMLEALRPGQDLRIVHRLDRDTSGCLLLGKGVEAARHFDREFTANRVHKTYLALVHGVPVQPTFAIDAWLGPDRRRPGKVVASATEQPGYRAAHTEVVLREAFSRHALLALHPATGRGHQLRVHLQSVGHPIVGDADYGGEPLLLSAIKPGYKLRVGVAERPLTPRLFLHSAELGFRDLDGKDVVVATPLADDLATALRQLGNHDEPRRRPCG